MHPDNHSIEEDARYQGSPNHRLLEKPLRGPVEELVSRHYHTPWRAAEFTDLVDFASHPAAILSDGDRSVFVKLSEAAHGLDQFEVELAGLRDLSALAGVMVPALIGMADVEGGIIMVLETVHAVERGAEQWREIGRTLARIHSVKGDACGFHRQGYFGPLFQDNRPMQNWLDFYLERRLWPRLMGAIDSGFLPSETIRRVEKLAGRLPGLDLPASEPRLLHGDAQQNNFISTVSGAVIIDPAVHYGCPEYDLAYIDYFQPVPGEVFDGYREILPIAPGFAERRALWRIPALLAAVQVSGADQLWRLEEALNEYL